MVRSISIRVSSISETFINEKDTSAQIDIMFLVSFLKLPLHVRRHICAYDCTFEDYIHIKYTCHRLNTRFYMFVPYSIVQTLGLMRCVRYFFVESPFPKYTSMGVSRLLAFYGSITPWSENVVDFYPWSLHVVIALLACGYVPSCIHKTNPTEWRFNIELRPRFQKVQYQGTLLTI